MTAVIDQNTPKHIMNSRLIWAWEPQEYLKIGNVKSCGIYSFGGIDDTTGKCTDDLFQLTPLTGENSKMISVNQDTKGFYLQRVIPEIIFRAERVKTHGRGPMPRYQHAACYF